MESILVLDGHCDAAVAVVQSLGRGRAQITVASKDPGALACRSRYASRLLSQPSTLPEALGAWLEAVDRDRRFDLIVPSTETSLLAVRRIPESSPLRARCLVPSDDAIDLALDKLGMTELMRSLGADVPDRTILVEDDHVSSWLGYPHVLKPRRSKFVHQGELITGDASIIRTPGEGAAYRRTWGDDIEVVGQTFVGGSGFAVAFLSLNGQLQWHFAYERVHEVPPTGGPSSLRRSVRCPGHVLDLCRMLARELAWTGVAMVEFRHDARSNRYVFLEVNPRLWGSLALAVGAGVDFPKGLLDAARGEPLGAQPIYRVSVYGLNVLREQQRSYLEGTEAGRTRWDRCRARLRTVGRILGRRERFDHVTIFDPAVTVEMMRRIARNARDHRGKGLPDAT